MIVQSTRKRGRPKGTGIDDSDRIARLTELLRVQPDLKPTTAIRAMGVSDPSVIRRLRDKYKHMLSLAGTNTPQPVPARVAIQGVAAETPGPFVVRFWR